MKASGEFVVGKHKIGWVDSDFLPRMGDKEFSEKPVPTFRKLGKYMTDAEIESELKPGLCDLGDILAFLKNPPEECKDGYANLFYTSAFVVFVRWDGVGGGWSVGAWRRGGRRWIANDRVFSPATVSSDTRPSSESSTLDSSNLIKNLTKIKIIIEIPQQQMDRLPENVSHFLELAALEKLGLMLERNCQTDIPFRKIKNEEKLPE